METHVKERLTGALILVALLVVVVPEMLSGPAPRAQSSDSAASEADGPPLRTYSMDLGAPRTGDAADQSELAPQTAASRDDAGSPPAAAAPRDLPVSEPVAAPAPEPEPISEVAALPAPQSAVAAEGSRWWVQVGSFSQSANAGRITRELGTAGIAAVVSPIKSNGKELFRVRAGPVADRAAAEALRERLAASGHKGTLVAP